MLARLSVNDNNKSVGGIMGGRSSPMSSVLNSIKNSGVLVCLLAGGISFFIANVIIEHSLANNDIYSNWERFKNGYLRNVDSKNTNVLILGSSKSFRGIDTSLLNKRSAEAECGLQFYNGSIPGMSSVEFMNYLDAVESNPNFNPRYIVFMPSVFRSKTSLLSQRRRNNALIRMWRINMLSLSAQSQSLRAYLNLHLSMLQRAVNKSKFSRGLFYKIDKPRIPIASFTVAQSLDGYLSLDDDPRYGLNHRRRLKFINSREASEALISRLRQQAILEPSFDLSVEGIRFNASAEMLLSLYINKIRSLDAEPIVVHFPELDAFPERLYYQEEFPNMRNLAANDQIEKFQELDLWYDHEHFSKQGATLFTSMLFEQMCTEQPLI
jgi:hypothetical protein